MATFGTRATTGSTVASTVEQDAAFFASRRTLSWPRQHISPRLRLLLWSLRLYVVLMLAVVAVALVHILQ